jgi:endonuclease/exonuclease/phosphatase family metal-dependent hydrolase/SAM-dependent methyltransferase
VSPPRPGGAAPRRGGGGSLARAARRAAARMATAAAAEAAWDAIAQGYGKRAAHFTGSFAPDLLAAAGIGGCSGGSGSDDAEEEDAGGGGGGGGGSPSVVNLLASTGGGSKGIKVLDVAAGTGCVALAAAATVGVAEVHAVDVSAAMLRELSAAAAASLPPGGAASVATTRCDALALPFDNGSFDAAVSNFGVIFAGDLAAGLAEMARVTRRPGGRVAFTTWGRTPAFTVIEDTWRAHPDAGLREAAPPPPKARPPIGSDTVASAAAADVARITQQMAATQAVTDITVFACEHELVLARAEDYWERMLVSSPSRRVNMQARLSVDQIEALRQATLQTLRRQFGDHEVRLVAEAFVCAATKKEAQCLSTGSTAGWSEPEPEPEPETEPELEPSMAANSVGDSETLSFLSLNVHGWRNEQRVDTFDDLVSMLRATTPDVIALQEASKQRLPALAQALGGMHWTLRNNCAILSRFALTVRESYKTSAGGGVGKAARGSSTSKKRAVAAGTYREGANDIKSVQSEKAHVDRLRRGKGSAPFKRYCVASITPWEGCAIDVCCLHLDHVRETTRLEQLRSIMAQQLEPDHQRPSRQVWLGDFNSLTRADWDDAEWRRITDQRTRSHWEAPSSDVSRAMTMSSHTSEGSALPALAFTDCWRAAEERRGPLGTSRFGTRIDYIFCSPAFMRSVAVHQCEHHQTTPQVSDHNAVRTLLVRRNGASGSGLRPPTVCTNK